MMVTLIVGLIVAIALPRYNRVQDKARFAAIGNDLRNLGASQERFHQMHSQYSTSLDLLDFTPTEGVEIEVLEASPSGWAAWATHAALGEGKGCSLYLGNASPPPLPNGDPHGGASGMTRCAQ
jgi:Tfp pilus assembly protein PilE